MKAVKKFSTFEELKSSEKKIVDAKLSMERHAAFEKVMKRICELKIQNGNSIQPK